MIAPEFYYCPDCKQDTPTDVEPEHHEPYSQHQKIRPRIPPFLICARCGWFHHYLEDDQCDTATTPNSSKTEKQ